MSINVAAIPSPFIHATIKRRKNTWYTIASGNWSDPNIWMSNSHRRYAYPASGSNTHNLTTAGFYTAAFQAYPTANDDVFINHSVTLDTSTNSTALVVNNLYVSGSLATGASARGISVVGDLQVTGTLDISGSANSIIGLYGVNNFVNNFISGANSTVTYTRAGDQPIMDLSYRHLSLWGTGTKYLTNNLSVAGNLVEQAGSGNNGLLTIECSTYNFTVTGTSSFTGGVLSKTGSGGILFVGAVSHTSIAATAGISLTGNPSVEFRGGCTYNGTPSTYWNTGTGTWSFTTATQTATFTSGTFPFSAPISVVGAIAVSEAGTGIMSLNQPIDCTSASGSVVAKGTIYFNSTSSLPSFTTGTFDRTSFANTVGYTMGASITLPYTSYSSLLVSNSGTKTAAGSTTLSGNYTGSNALGTGGTFELGTSNLTVNGTTSLSNGLSKSGAGNVLFVGLVSNGGNSTNRGAIDFSGNPTVELRGGLSILGGFAFSSFNTGTSQWKFSTNSQAISGGNVSFVFDAPILISGAITVTLTPAAAALTVQANNTINGDNAASKLVVGSGTSFDTTLALNNSTTPMLTGILDITTSSKSIVSYMFDGDFTIPLTSYNGLAIEGAGTKTLSGNTVLGYTLRIGSSVLTVTSTLECASFNLSVSSTTQLNWNSIFSKTGAGNILLADTVLSGGNGSPSIALSGNPTVELRNGINLNNRNTTIISGTNAWTFSTNNQTIQNIASGTSALSCPIIISGAITLTIASTSNVTFASTLNGNNAASTFDNRGTVQYQATQQPMLTGVLQTNLAANTFLYNAAGNQDVKGGTYRTLTLAGSGVKTLQGNVVVATLYTLTPPATLALNGFTRT